MKKRIAILGSTGSIGTQALEVVQQHLDIFEPLVLTAGQNADLLIEQAIRFLPKYVVIADETKYTEVRDALSRFPIKVLAGVQALTEVVTLREVDMVLAAMVGFAGLLPTIAAVSVGKNVALANKETLVVAGALITKLARKNGSGIYPVDSEHSAIFQCMAVRNQVRLKS
jgi:1-deoxy-D-xylulose-5-phosphate reductoisomerase